MSARFSVLASSSSGNASYLDLDGFGILIDFGIGPRKLTRLLDAQQIGFDEIQAVVLTHTHGDHWSEPTLNLFARTGTPLWCHPDHAADLDRQSEAFHDLRRAGLVHSYFANQTFSLGPCVCTPLPLWHDVITFGFRFEGTHGPNEEPWAMGYASDLGSWAGDLIDRLAEVDLLALEFNHDVEMQLGSDRHGRLIDRVLGDVGHLSNVQAAKLLREVLKRTATGRLRHLVPLHLSSECNHPDLVREAAELVRRSHDAAFSIDLAAPSAWFQLGNRPMTHPVTAPMLEIRPAG